MHNKNPIWSIRNASLWPIRNAKQNPKFPQTSVPKQANVFCCAFRMDRKSDFCCAFRMDHKLAFRTDHPLFVRDAVIGISNYGTNLFRVEKFPTQCIRYAKYHLVTSTNRAIGIYQYMDLMIPRVFYYCRTNRREDFSVTKPRASPTKRKERKEGGRKEKRRKEKKRTEKSPVLTQ